MKTPWGRAATRRNAAHLIREQFDHQEMGESVKGKLAKGDCVSESEVIRAELRALGTYDQALAHWLETKVAPAYDTLRADPSRGIPIKKMAANLSAVGNARRR